MTTLSSSPPDYDPNRTGELDFERPEGGAPVTFWRQATPGTTYVRCLLPARHLGGQSLPLESRDLHWDDEADRLMMPRHQGAAVWQFLGDDNRGRVALGLQDTGVRTLMEVDDNYLQPHPHVAGQVRGWFPTIADAKRAGGSYSNEMHCLLVPLMDGVIVSTPYLREQYLEYTDDVFVCPNTVEPDDWFDLEEKDPAVLRIVYSGSQSHLRDAPQLNKALKWASRQKGVEVWLQGVNPPWGFATQVPWTNSLQEYRRVLGRFDVGLAPVVPGKWANGKSDLKALEYTMASVVPLLAREEPYRPWFDKPEFLVDSDERAWLEKVKWVVRNRDALPGMLDVARAYVLDERTTEANVWKWEKAIGIA